MVKNRGLKWSGFESRGRKQNWCQGKSLYLLIKTYSMRAGNQLNIFNTLIEWVFYTASSTFRTCFYSLCTSIRQENSTQRLKVWTKMWKACFFVRLNVTHACLKRYVYSQFLKIMFSIWAYCRTSFFDKCVVTLLSYIL